jgi:hypothetical protein
MAFGENDVKIKITADDQTQQGVTSAKRNVGGLGSTVNSLRSNWLAVGVAAGVATAAFVGAGSAAFALANLASDLEESQNKANVVFGESVSVINDFASDAATALGQTEQAVLEASGTLGNLFTAMGLTGEAAAGMSVQMVQLATDIGSFQNISTDEALISLRAGLVGEAEPMRRLGVLLSAATVEAKALEMGLAGTTSALTEADKVQARYALILEQTSVQQGDFARTSDGLANQIKILDANIKTLSADIGETLVPIVNAAVTAFNDLFDAGPRAFDEIAAAAREAAGSGSVTTSAGDTRFSSGFLSDVDRSRLISLQSGGISPVRPDIEAAMIDAIEGGFENAKFGFGAFNPNAPGGIASFQSMTGDALDPLVARALEREREQILGDQSRALEAWNLANKEATRTAGTLTAAERSLIAERERQAGSEMLDLVEAYANGKQAAVDARREQLAEEQAAFDEWSEGLGQALGINGDLYRSFWDDFEDQTKEGVQAAIDEAERLAKERERLAIEGVQAAIDEEQRLANERLHLEARNRRLMIGAALANPVAAANTPGFLDSLSGNAPPLQSGPMQVVVQIGDKTVEDVVVAAIHSAELTGQL